MEEDNIKQEKSIKMITRPTMNGLIKAANEINIKEGSIVSIVRGDNQYHLVYYGNG